MDVNGGHILNVPVFPGQSTFKRSINSIANDVKRLVDQLLVTPILSFLIVECDLCSSSPGPASKIGAKSC